MTGLGICHFLFNCFEGFDSVGFLLFLMVVGLIVGVIWLAIKAWKHL